MNNRKTKVIGIDFGTANTYVSEYSLEPETGEKIRAIDFGYNQVGIIPSSILYRKERPAVIGKRAEDEWGEATEAEKKTYSFKTHFKPEITYSKEAADDASAFLIQLAKECRQRSIDIFDDNSLIIFGIPAESSGDYRKSFESILRSAGINRFKIIYEPVAALIHHLHYGDISPADAEEGILVVDFGGGTCDFTFMHNLNPGSSWGDLDYGGRLFDDLFFQWYCQQNPGKSKELKKRRSDYYVHWVICSKAKEYFSDAMQSDKGDVFNYSLGNIENYGVLKNLKFNEFMERSLHYSPTDSMKKKVSDKSETFKNSGETDLINWFEHELVGGMRDNSINPEDVTKVILTGGSSQWLFVKDIVNKVFNSEDRDDFILRSKNPKSAISEGLAILPYLKNKLNETSKSLNADLNRFVKQNLTPGIEKRLHSALSRVAGSIDDAFLDSFHSTLLQFRKNGGSIESFENSLVDNFEKIRNKLEEDMPEKIAYINKGMRPFVNSEINDWFKLNGIRYFGKSYGKQVNLKSIDDKKIPDIYANFYSVISHSIECVIAVVIGSVCGGHGLALIASGPVGWIIGAAVGLIVSYLVLKTGRKQTKEKLKKYRISRIILKMIFSRHVISYLIKKQKSKLNRSTDREFSLIVKSYTDEIVQELRSNIEQCISQLTLLNQMKY